MWWRIILWCARPSQYGDSRISLGETPTSCVQLDQLLNNIQWKVDRQMRTRTLPIARAQRTGFVPTSGSQSQFCTQTKVSPTQTVPTGVWLSSMSVCTIAASWGKTTLSCGTAKETRHIGHVLFVWSHVCRQSAWKLCWHGVSCTLSFGS